MSGRWTWSLVFSVGVTGCSGGQSGTETDVLGCGTTKVTTPIGPDDPTADGTARELAAAVAGEHRTSIRYGNPLEGTYVDTELVLQLSVDFASARAVTSIGSDGQPLAWCGPSLEVDGELRFETVDGAFVERLAGTLTEVRFAATLPASELRGSYHAGSLLSQYVDPTYSLFTIFSPSLSGDMFLDGASPDGEAHVGRASIASWPVPGSSAPDGGP